MRAVASVHGLSRLEVVERDSRTVAVAIECEDASILDAFDRGALIRALLPDAVRDYLADLIDAMDDGQELEWGHSRSVRAETFALLSGN